MVKKLMIGAGLAALMVSSAMAQSYNPAIGTGNIVRNPSVHFNQPFMSYGYASPYASIGFLNDYAYAGYPHYWRDGHNRFYSPLYTPPSQRGLYWQYR